MRECGWNPNECPTSMSRLCHVMSVISSYHQMPLFLREDITYSLHNHVVIMGING